MVNVGKYTSPMDPMGIYIYMPPQLGSERATIQTNSSDQPTKRDRIHAQESADV